MLLWQFSSSELSNQLKLKEFQVSSIPANVDFGSFLRVLTFVRCVFISSDYLCVKNETHRSWVLTYKEYILAHNIKWLFWNRFRNVSHWAQWCRNYNNFMHIKEREKSSEEVVVDVALISIFYERWSELIAFRFTIFNSFDLSHDNSHSTQATTHSCFLHEAINWQFIAARTSWEVTH